eukprot:CAMPEP_0172792496 /NCGR_PEP_ID=MMETSP1074-20121228/209002_1 /TAXON_ID=2916 /ORGANISM="Ceratium fusus, Strain PA161109" /LENGTH=44 /DNA_ID= /DNA_START= /DNA_END= /DNA_ORIENTATION=
MSWYSGTELAPQLSGKSFSKITSAGEDRRPRSPAGSTSERDQTE